MQGKNYVENHAFADATQKDAFFSTKLQNNKKYT
jgi:hypothetical protein